MLLPVEGMVSALVLATFFLVLALWALEGRRDRLFILLLALCVFCVSVFISGAIAHISAAGKKLDYNVPREKLKASEMETGHKGKQMDTALLCAAKATA